MVFSLTVLVGCAGLPIQTTLDPSDIGLDRLRQPQNPPEISVATAADAPRAVARLDARRLADLADRAGVRRLGAAQVPFFFGSDLGRAYLKSDGPRALAFGDPADSCAAVGVALQARDVTTAARSALSQCVARAGCACRLAAAGDVLLAPLESFDYARAVTASMRIGGDAPIMLLAEDRPQEPTDGPVLSPLDALEAGGARQRVALFSPRDLSAGPIGALTLEADGAAQLTARVGGAERRYVGRWTSEGRRRGWFARTVAMRPADGRSAAAERLLLLIGYEPAELSERQERLFAAAGQLL